MKTSNADKSIVHVLCSLSLSGAHIFAINLANEQSKHFNVSLLFLNPYLNDASLMNRIDSKVKIINLKLSRLVKSGAYRISNLFSGMAQNSPFYVNMMAWKLKDHLKGVDIVHTHLVRDRLIVSKALKMVGQHAPLHILTDHGGFLGIESTAGKNGNSSRIYNQKVFKEIFDSCACIVTLSETQNAFWQRKQNEGYFISYCKIYNGNPLSKSSNTKSRNEMGYAEDDFIFTMVARGDQASKGWELTIDAFLLNDDPKSRLMLIGGGNEVDRLKVIHGGNPKINFVGHVHNPIDFLPIVDVGVLASTYTPESLPNSIIEYLQAGKPVIGSDIGEIKNMLQIGKNEAGILLPIKNKQIDINIYADAMRKMQHEKDSYENFKRNALNASKQFDMAYCMYRYATEIYKF